MDLQSRIEKLEHDNRRLKALALALLLPVAALSIWQIGIGSPQRSYAQEPKVTSFGIIEAEGFYVVSHNRTRIATFGNAGDDTGYLTLKNKKDNVGVWVGCDPDATGYINVFKQGKGGKRIKP